MPKVLPIEGKVFQFKREIREDYFELRLSEVLNKSNINSDGYEDDEIEKTTFKWIINHLRVFFKDLSKDERLYAYKIINFEVLQFVNKLEDNYENAIQYNLEDESGFDKALIKGEYKPQKPLLKWEKLRLELDKLLKELDDLKVHTKGSKGRPPSEIVHFKDCLRLDETDFAKLLYVLREYFEGKYWVGFNKRKSGFGSLMKVLMELDYTKDKEGTIKYLPISTAFCNSFLPKDEAIEYIERFRKELNTNKEDELEALRKLIPSADKIHLTKLPR